MLGAALPLPGGLALGTALAAAIGSPTAGPADILATLTSSSEAREKALEFAANHEAEMLRITVGAEQARAATDAADRASARQASVDGGTAGKLFWLSLALLALCIGSEIAVLFVGYPRTVDPIVVGRVLGLLDSVALVVISFWFGSSSGSARKSELIAAAGKA
jgi:hypothetical protein